MVSTGVLKPSVASTAGKGGNLKQSAAPTTGKPGSNLLLFKMDFELLVDYKLN